MAVEVIEKLLHLTEQPQFTLIPAEIKAAVRLASEHQSPAVYGNISFKFAVIHTSHLPSSRIISRSSFCPKT